MSNQPVQGKTGDASKWSVNAGIATIIVAIIGLVGTITVAYFQFIAQPKIIIKATETAKAMPAQAPLYQPTDSMPTSPPPEATTCPGAPIITSFGASPTSIYVSESSTLTWSASINVANVMIDQGIGTVMNSGSMVVRPVNTTTYTITASGCGGTQTDHVTVNVTSYGTVTGRVVSYGNGNGIGNVNVDLNGNYQSLTNGNGDFQISNVKPGKYVLHINAIGYEENPSTITLDSFSGQTTNAPQIVLVPKPIQSGNNLRVNSSQCFDFEQNMQVNCGSSQADFMYTVNEAGLKFVQTESLTGGSYTLEIRVPSDQAQITYLGCYNANKAAAGWSFANPDQTKLICFKTSDGNLAAITVTSSGNDITFNWVMWGR